eukprot:augustus_masked-scaffold_12-processed-gene-3.6-mRNA-1 protein AED:1.00 eAED:1.00 QI:0/-1/0/0/-1/1/1/0/414
MKKGIESESSSSESDYDSEDDNYISKTEVVAAKKIEDENEQNIEAQDYELGDASESDSETSSSEEEEEPKTKNRAYKLTEEDKDELTELLSDYEDKSKILRDQISPLLQAYRNAESSRTEFGLTYLEAKYQLLLNYCINLAYYLKLKFSAFKAGRNESKHEMKQVILHLSRMKTYLEKIRPLDEKVRPLITELLQNRKTKKVLPSVKDFGSAKKRKREEKYVAPKIAGVEFQEKKSKKERKKKEISRIQEKLKKNEMLKDLQTEINEAPESLGGDFEKEDLLGFEKSFQQLQNLTKRSKELEMDDGEEVLEAMEDFMEKMKNDEEDEEVEERAVEQKRIVDPMRNILQNRGLQTYRKKSDKNPRKKLRRKYEKKLKAQKGQVRPMRDKTEGENYGGERTGVKSNIVRSRIVGKF